MAENTHEVRQMVEYLSPGALFAEESSRELTERSVEEAVEKAPAHAFAFTLYELPVVDFEYDETRFRIAPIAQNKSPRYYLGGTIFSEPEVEAMGPEARTLLENMRGNDWSRVIETRAGNWQPFEDGDEIVKPKLEVARG